MNIVPLPDTLGLQEWAARAIRGRRSGIDFDQGALRDALTTYLGALSASSIQDYLDRLKDYCVLRQDPFYDKLLHALHEAAFHEPLRQDASAGELAERFWRRMTTSGARPVGVADNALLEVTYSRPWADRSSQATAEDYWRILPQFGMYKDAAIDWNLWMGPYCRNNPRITAPLQSVEMAAQSRGNVHACVLYGIMEVEDGKRFPFCMHYYYSFQTKRWYLAQFSHYAPYELAIPY